MRVAILVVVGVGSEHAHTAALCGDVSLLVVNAVFPVVTL